MKLVKIEVKNFRLLESGSIRLDTKPPTTILVGPNNSGKTSVAEILLLFAGGGKKSISVYDFSMACRSGLEKAQAEMLAEDGAVKASASLPSIVLDLHFTYSDDGADLAVAADLLMDLDAGSHDIALRIKYAAADPLKLAADFRAKRKENETLFDFLLTHLREYFEFSHHKFSSKTGEAEGLDDKKIIDRLIKVDFVFAQRYIDDQESSRATRLSHLLHDHYDSHYKSSEPEIHEEIENSLKAHAAELGGRYMKAFQGLLTNLKTFGYPQKQAPSMSIRAEFNSETLLRDTTRIYYGVSAEAPAATAVVPVAVAAPSAPVPFPVEPVFVASPAMPVLAGAYELPEKYNGLGFKNLIYMVLQMQSFRAVLEKTPVDRPRVHLIFIEEPETHLHPQVQSVFIKQILAFLTRDGTGTDVQLILTTHSSHIVSDCGFAPIRYFRRNGNRVVVKDLTELKGKKDAQEAVRFLSKYMSLMKCDLFFADKAILVEGAVERVLVPKMIADCATRGYTDFASEYVSIMEVGGAHAHMFKALLKFIEIPTLIITDLDSIDANGKACSVANGTTTSNATLKSWLPAKTTLGELKAATSAEKTDGLIRAAYQIAEDDKLPCARSFEEAFIYRNAAWLIANSESLTATGAKFKKDSDVALIGDAYGLKLTKVDFALDVLVADGWASPRYITEGLEWLAQAGGTK